MPITDELHDLVGNPVPSGDLATRARLRATALRRRRMAGIMTSVVAIGVIAVPGAVLVRDRAGSIDGSAGAGGALPSAAATTATGTTLSRAVAVPATTVEPGHTDKVNAAQIASAKALLGAGFTQTSVGIVVEPANGKVVGTAATFTAKGGGTVLIQWTAAPKLTVAAPALASPAPAPSAALASGATPEVGRVIAGIPSVAPASAVMASGVPAGVAVSAGLPETGAVLGSGVTVPSGTSPAMMTGSVVGNAKTQVRVVVVQDQARGTKLLPGDAVATLAKNLLKVAG